MNASRILLSRTSQSLLAKTVTKSIPSIGGRNLSTQGIAAVNKLRNVLEEYRKENCTQELPSRVKKELIQAAQNEGFVDQNGMNRVIHNIHKDDEISFQDLELIFQEHGGKLRVDEMMKLL